jgi:PEGA domain
MIASRCPTRERLGRATRARRRLARKLLGALLLWDLVAPGPALAQPSAGREDAVARFERGIQLFDRGAYGVALAEFREARRLYPLRNAVYQAGLCLEKLQRYDEALVEFETALGELGEGAPAPVKESLQRRVLEMRGLVGEIAIDRAEPGATVTVDGLDRGEHPLLAPLRVAAGSHMVRVFKVGFLPFERQLVVAGGTTERVEARLLPLGPTGRIRIAEQGGRVLDVLVDGSRVGATPGGGPLAPGPHVCVLRGKDSLGTPPVQIRVEVDRTTVLTLQAEELSAMLHVAPVPVNAAVAVDGLSVANGVWEGRLHQGRHRVEVSAEGFLPVAEDLTLGHDERREFRVELTRDPRSSFSRRPSRFTVQAALAPVFAPLLGGEAAGNCGDGCGADTPMGGYAMLRGGYELGLGLGFGVEAGGFAATQRLMGRTVSLTAVGHPPELASVDDTLWIHAAVVGVWAAYSLDLRIPIHLRLGGGALLGAASDTRAAATTPGVEPAGETRPLRAAYVAPEIRVGLVTLGRVEIDAGVEMLAAFAAPSPAWSPTHLVVVDRSSGLREIATFRAETFAGPILSLLPGLGARYRF